MFGIAGFFSPRLAQPPALLGAMLAAVRHRGPDVEGKLLVPRQAGGLAPGRPAGNGVEAADAAEPVAAKDGALWLAFNGEVYNHLAPRAGLERSGHRFLRAP